MRTVLHSILIVFIISLSLQICTGAFNRLYLKPGKPSTAVEKDSKSSLRKERKALARDASIWKDRYSLWHNVSTIYFYFFINLLWIRGADLKEQTALIVNEGYICIQCCLSSSILCLLEVSYTHWIHLVILNQYLRCAFFIVCSCLLVYIRAIKSVQCTCHICVNSSLIIYCLILLYSKCVFNLTQ